ncbi:MAG: polysaccharide biosynthesis protein [Fusobacteriaceae bacterium]
MTNGFMGNKRNFIKIFLDIGAIYTATLLALLIRFDKIEWDIHLHIYFGIYLGFFLLGYFYRRTGVKSWSYTNSLDVLSLVVINLFAFVGETTYYALQRMQFSRSVLFLIFLIGTILQLSMRFLFRLNRVVKKSQVERKNTIIYGGGDAGVALIRESIANPYFPYNFIGIIDDDSKKRGNYINGIKVLGNSLEIDDILEQKEPDLFIIAIPAIKKDKIAEIVKQVKSHRKDMTIKILPGIDELLQGEGMLSQVRDVSIDDLLGRDQILVNGDSIRGLIQNKTVFVTGGAGSIGSELSRQIAKQKPKKLVAIDVNENALYFLELELKRLHPNLDFQSEICNIRERDKVEYLFHKYRPEIIFHAAAHKHVPLMEHNPEEAIKNNIFGTRNVTDMADKYGAQRFVLISTDKAVNPTNVMGATKRGCELVVEDANKKSTGTKFMAVRFGNVLGSNGSVIPIFRDLIAQGKNLTITHRDITRYFMTIPEAAQLVIEAGSLGEGGEVFILDMGEPVRIMDLANKMIELSGADVGIDVIGLRPGEKLYEELLYDVKNAERTPNQKIFITRIREEEIDIEPHLNELWIAVKTPDIKNLKAIIKKFIVSYREPEHHKEV